VRRSVFCLVAFALKAYEKKKKQLPPYHAAVRARRCGASLEALYASYTTGEPPVHSKLLGKILFAKMLNVVYPNIGPHKNTNHTVTGMYLLR
jgi:hypothetical protein